MVNLLRLKEQDSAAYALTRASLLQKLIRRSMLAEALWTAKLFVDDGHVAGLKRRLLQIAAEDLGLVYPELIYLLYTEEDVYKQIGYLCLLPKSQEVSRFYSNVTANPQIFKTADEDMRKEINALSALILTATEWEENRRQKVKLTELKNHFLTISQTSPFPKTVVLAGDLFVEMTRKNMHGARLMLALAVLLSTRKSFPQEQLPDVSALPAPKVLLEVPDFALDMHTPMGKQLGRGYEHWKTEGAKLIPELLYPEQYRKDGQIKYPLD